MAFYVLRYAAECLIALGNRLSELSGGNTTEISTKAAPLKKRNWMVSTFGEWPIRLEHGGIDINIDPCFVVLLSSITAAAFSAFLWLIYTFYFKIVWLESNVRNEETISCAQNRRDDNYSTPRSFNELSPNAPQGSAGVSEIPHHSRRCSPSQRLSRKPTALNIETNFDEDAHARPIPRTPLQPEPSGAEPSIEELQMENNCPVTISEDGVDVDRIEESDDDESDNQRLYESQNLFRQVQCEDQSETEEAEELARVDCANEQEEDSDSSSQTEYARYHERGDDVSAPPPSNSDRGDHEKRIVDDPFKEKEMIQERRSTLVDALLEISIPMQDRVVLHQFQRGRSGSVPCLAPFSMKLETYLRMAEIEHDVVFDCDSSGPWLTYHNEHFKGASSCMQFLQQVFPSQTENFSPSPDMDVVSWFITILVEYHLYWQLIIWRWIINEGRDILHNQPNWNLIFPDPKEVRECVKLGALYHGFGHISDNITDVKKAVRKDLEALSESLGEKDFLTGTAPKEVDCSAFAILSQLLWSSSDPIFKANMKSFPSNLICYCERMKSILWPDWSDLLSKDEDLCTNIATYDSSAETSPLASPRSVATSSRGSFSDFKHNPKSFVFRLPHSLRTETTEVIVRKTFTENQYWNLRDWNVTNIPNSLNLCAEEYFDENLEDMESIKMKMIDVDGDAEDDLEDDPDNPEHDPECS